MKLALTILLAASALYAGAQNVVALHTSSGEQMFSNPNAFIDAYTAASDGDTIYLPGGSFNVPTQFNKRLVIYGTGIHVDSTQATNKTIFSNSVNFYDGADSSHIEGITIQGAITISDNEQVDNLVIKRNYFEHFTAYGANTANKSDNVLLIGNYVRTDLNFVHASNVKVFNNVFRRLSNIEVNGWIANNIILNPSSYSFQNVYETLFENNYIYLYYGSSGIQSQNCSFVNNVFSHDPTGNTWNTFTGNYVSLSEATIFVNHQPSMNFETADYHLNDPVTYIGTTGDQIGIYGGYQPVKEGAVPVNPHIRSATIAPSTNPAGELNINIEVGSQDQ